MWHNNSKNQWIILKYNRGRRVRDHIVVDVTNYLSNQCLSKVSVSTLLTLIEDLLKGCYKRHVVQLVARWQMLETTPHKHKTWCYQLGAVASVIVSLSVTCGRSVVFSGNSGFLHQEHWPPRYNWNIVESGVKHNSPNSCNQLLCRRMWYNNSNNQ